MPGGLLMSLLALNYMQGPLASLPPRARPPVVRDRPYVAEFRCHDRESGKLFASGKMFRDRVGRTRIDCDYDGHRIRVIDDVIKSSVFFVLVEEKAFQAEIYGQFPTDWSFRSVAPVYTGDFEELMAIRCERVALKSLAKGRVSGDDSGEAWISREHDIVMKEVAPHEGWVWEITMLEFREPAADTFDVPAGFRSIEES